MVDHESSFNLQIIKPRDIKLKPHLKAAKRMD